MKASTSTDIEAEKICIGAAMTSTDALDRLMDALNEEAFYHVGHRHIWTVLQRMWRADQRPSMPDVAETLDYDNLLDKAGGIEYLSALELDSRGYDLALYIERIRTAQKKRRLLSLARHLSSAAEGDDVEKVINEASREISDIATLTTKEPADFKETIKDQLIDEWKVAKRDRDNGVTVMKGPPYGLSALDEITQGMVPSHLVIIGARTGAGKTEFLSQIIANCFRQGVPAAVFSMEMSAAQYATRCAGPLIGVHGNRLASGKVTSEEIARLDEFKAHMLDRYKEVIKIDDRAGPTVDQIKAVTRRLIQAYGVRVVFVDHLGLVRGLGHNLYEQTTQVSKALKEMAMELGVCVIAAAQINRQAAEGIPQNHHLRDSGSIEQDADQIILLHRSQEQGPESSTLGLHVTKNRYGPQQVLKYNYHYNSATMRDYVPIELHRAELQNSEMDRYTP